MKDNLKLSDEILLLQKSNGGILKIGRDNDKKMKICLRTAECNILKHLHELEGELVSKEQLIKIGWPDTVVGSNSLNVAISNLRKSLKQSELEIVNLRSKGYKMELKEVEQSRSTETNTENKVDINEGERKLIGKIVTFVILVFIMIFDFIIFNEYDQIQCEDFNYNSVKCLFFKR